MEDHRLRTELSLALHAAVAERLPGHPEIVPLACARIEAWIAGGGSSTPLLLKWREVLALPTADIQRVLTERSQTADWLRKASPFGGAIPPRERERILRDVRQRIESAA